MDRVELDLLINEAMERHIRLYHTDKVVAGGFKPPTRDEIVAFCQEKTLALDVDKFLDFYGSKGWRVGKVPMKDWRAAARNAVRDGWGRAGPGGQKPRPPCNKCRQPADFRFPGGSPFCRACQPKGYATYGDNL
jgi:hypothetical protein